MSTTKWWVSGAIAAAGPAAIGACIGLPQGALRTVEQSVLVSAITIGVAALMIPALYVGSTIAGVSPPANQVWKGGVAALRSCGMLLLGLSPAALFLAVTSQQHWAAWLYGSLALAVGCVVGLRMLFRELFGASDLRLRAAVVFGPWALVTMGLAARMFAKTLVG